MEGKAALAADLPNKILPGTPLSLNVSALCIGNSVRRQDSGNTDGLGQLSAAGMRCRAVSAEVPGLCSADDLFCERGPENVPFCLSFSISKADS